MKTYMIFCILIILIIYSCNNSENREKEIQYIDALNRSNTFIQAQIEDRIRSSKFLASRQHGGMHPLWDSVHSINKEINILIKKTRRDSIDIDPKEINNYVEKLELKYKLPEDLLSYLKSTLPADSENNKLSPTLYITRLLLLENDIVLYCMRHIHSDDYKLGSKEAIFKIDSNTYFAIISAKSVENKHPPITLLNVYFNGKPLNPDSYVMKINYGFMGVILNLDTEENYLGEYQIEYSIDWRDNLKNKIPAQTSNSFFIIDE